MLRQHAGQVPDQIASVSNSFRTVSNAACAGTDARTHLVVPVLLGANRRRVAAVGDRVKVNKLDVAACRALRHPLLHDQVARAVGVQQRRALRGDGKRAMSACAATVQQ